MISERVAVGVTGAKAGTLSFLVGGTESSFKRSERILSLMGQRIIHCGASGSGLGAKICNNVGVTSSTHSLTIITDPSSSLFLGFNKSWLEKQCCLVNGWD